MYKLFGQKKRVLPDRVGLFGGTFNPIHLGHLRAAHEVQTAFGLDKIYIIPSALPPHKEPRDIASVQDRLQMCFNAVENYPDLRNTVSVSNIELQYSSGPSYTIDTVNRFNSALPENTELFFIMGLDTFLEIDSWKDYKELFKAIRFIIAARPGVLPQEEKRPLHEIIKDYLDSVVSDGYQYNESKSCFMHAENYAVYFFEGNPLDISSTEIRELVRNGKSIESLVPEKVENYIITEGLFK